MVVVKIIASIGCRSELIEMEVKKGLCNERKKGKELNDIFKTFNGFIRSHLPQLSVSFFFFFC